MPDPIEPAAAPAAGTPAATPAAPAPAPAAAATPAAPPGGPPDAGATPAAAPSSAPSILSDKGVVAAPDTGKQQVPATWPSDWRDKLAAEIKPGDTKFRERLERFASPVEVTRSWLALEQKQSAGELKPRLPDNATPEEIAEYRKTIGVPEKPENYSLELPGGKKFGTEDEFVISRFLQAAHAQNWPQTLVTSTLDAFHGMKIANEAQVAEADAAARQKGEDALRAEWGADYRRNVTSVGNLLAGMPEGLSDLLIEGRLADGTRIGNHPGMIKWLAGLAMEYPSLVPAGESPGGTDRLAEIRKFRQQNPDRYDQDKAMQAEERRLLEIEVRRKPQQNRAA